MSIPEDPRHYTVQVSRGAGGVWRTAAVVEDLLPLSLGEASRHCTRMNAYARRGQTGLRYRIATLDGVPSADAEGLEEAFLSGQTGDGDPDAGARIADALERIADAMEAPPRALPDPDPDYSVQTLTEGVWRTVEENLPRDAAESLFERLVSSGRDPRTVRLK